MLSLLFHSAFFNAPFLVTLLLIFILGAAAVYDLKTLTIPHGFTYAVMALYIAMSLVVGFNIYDVGWHFISAIICLAIGFVLFVFGIMGGGDVKIFAALGLWLHPMGLFGLVPAIAITGACISIGALVYKMARLPTQAGPPQSMFAKYRLAKNQKIPYGPAIALGTILYLLLSGNL